MGRLDASDAPIESVFGTESVEIWLFERLTQSDGLEEFLRAASLLTPSLSVNRMGEVYDHFIHLYKIAMGHHEAI